MKFLTKSSFSNKLFVVSLIFLILLFISFAIFQFQREKYYKINILMTQLTGVNKEFYDYISNDSSYLSDHQKLSREIRKNYPGNDIRLTIISNSGTVIFDTESSRHDTFQNHLQRPEILALKNLNNSHNNYLLKNSAYSIRFSKTTNKDYFYVATRFSDIIIRSALPYETRAIYFLDTDNTFIYFVVALMAIGLFVIWHFSRKIKLNIKNLQLFVNSVRTTNKFDAKLNFPRNDLGEISEELVVLCQDLIKTKEQLNLEKQKFSNHLYSETEGVAIFSEDFNCIMSNRKFIEISNFVLDKVIVDPNEIFETNQKDIIIDALQGSNHEWIIEAHSKFVQVNLLKFDDNSFELILNDVTKKEKIKRFKKEITDNLSHELKTPLCSMQGYLETIINHKNLSPEKRDYFINKAFEQSQRMTKLLNDISKITRIDQAEDYFEIEKIKICEVIEKCVENVTQIMTEKNVNVQINVDKELIVNTNEELLISIFSNLISNSLAYAGENFDIGISAVANKDYVSFVYYDTGKGVEEKHLNRIFERFYRIDKGRTQKMGGTGLGLAIVNNAIKFHKGGSIVARIHSGGGLEFVFGWKI